jgi:polysaccharide pyruvyl transferase WcaK-like protein
MADRQEAASIKQTKLCITGSFGYRDIGDEAMLTECLDYILNGLGIPRGNIYLIGGQPEYISYYHNHPLSHCFASSWFENKQQFRNAAGRGKLKIAIKSVLKREYLIDRAIERVVRECDALLVTGGGTINTRDSRGCSIRRMHTLSAHFKQSGKPIFMSGQTIGPLGLNEEHDKLAAEIINAVDFLTVRDSLYSRRYLEIIKAEPKQFVETCDDACTLPYKDASLPRQINDFLKPGDAAAVNVTDYTADTQGKRSFVAGLCEHLIRDYGLKVIMVSHDVTDYFNLNIISDMIDNRLKSSIIVPDTRQWRGAMLKKLISCCRLAVGGRYHFIVFAGSSNTPFIGMAGNHYSYIKQDGFARAVGLEDFILTEKETWDMSVVKSRIKNALELKLDIADRFPRPSISMQHFGSWIRLNDNNAR